MACHEQPMAGRRVTVCKPRELYSRRTWLRKSLRRMSPLEFPIK